MYIVILIITALLFVSGLLMAACVRWWPRNAEADVQGSFGFRAGILGFILVLLAFIFGIGASLMGGDYYLAPGTKALLYAIGPGVNWLVFGGVFALAAVYLIAGKQHRFLSFSPTVAIRLIGGLFMLTMLWVVTGAIYLDLWAGIYQLDTLVAFGERHMASPFMTAALIFLAAVLLYDRVILKRRVAGRLSGK